MTFADRVRDILAVTPPPTGWHPPHDTRVEQGDPVAWEALVAPIQANLIRCLSDIEWVHVDDGLSEENRRCPWCLSPEARGHHPECVLGALLARGRTRAQPQRRMQRGSA